MSFILVAKQGSEVQVNGWNWRPTLELLVREHLLDRDDLYSATYEWLVTFRDFCRQSDGFDVF
jgi:hypothetical protein